MIVESKTRKIYITKLLFHVSTSILSRNIYQLYSFALTSRVPPQHRRELNSCTRRSPMILLKLETGSEGLLINNFNKLYNDHSLDTNRSVVI